MGEKKNINFQVDVNILGDFDQALDKFKKATGIKPSRTECFEVALKDYIEKINKQAEKLKNGD